MFAEAMRLAIMGYHFSKVTSQQIAVHELRDYLSHGLEALSVKLRSMRTAQAHGSAELQARLRDLTQGARERYTRIPPTSPPRTTPGAFRRLQAVERELTTSQLTS
jgi:hypothetical protein